MNENEKIWRKQIPYDIIIHCIIPCLTNKKTECQNMEMSNIIYLNKEIYESCKRYLSECRGKQHLNFYGKKICEIHSPIHFKIIDNFLKNKYDDHSLEKSNVHISYSSDSQSDENCKTIKYISGNYHPSEEIKQIIKENNNNIYNNHSLRDVYNRLEIFKDTPYNIKYLCCNGNGMRYSRKL